MTPSVELELKIYRFAESAGKARWHVADLPMLSTATQYHDWNVLVDALGDLFARNFVEYRRWDYGKNGWVVYDGRDQDYFNREFQMRVTFSGRKYFESLEAEASESGQSGIHMTTHNRSGEADEESALRAKKDSPLQPVLAPESTAPKAFVSHSTQDHKFVERFAADLRSKGINAWYSAWEIKPGDSIRAKIDEGLEGCEYFIIVLSKNSISRPWVQTELDAATVRKIGGKVRKIIPVKIEDCGDLPPTLGALCWEDFSNQPYHSALKRVLDSILDVDVRPPLGKVQTASTPMKEQTETKFPIYMDDLGTFAKQLQSEGFDARVDLFNGQVGLIVGPKGLDKERMPHDIAGLFFPLWELNHEGNRAFVSARKFHDIVEDRPSDWIFNRPYRMNVRQWNRSASMLGDKKLEDTIQRGLVSRFPVTDYPVNIDVVGTQDRTGATVRVTEFEAGINETTQAIPEDFLGSGGMTAAVIAASESVLSGLRQAGKLPGRANPNETKVSFESKCPNCGNPTTHQFAPGKLKKLLATDELKLYCIRCDQQWKPGSQEKLNLARWLESETAGQ